MSEFIREHRAICMKDEGNVVGVLLFSTKYNMVCFLAVDPDYRKKGIASALLEKAISLLDKTKDITVSTFREEDERSGALSTLPKIWLYGRQIDCGIWVPQSDVRAEVNKMNGSLDNYLFIRYNPARQMIMPRTFCIVTTSL